MFKQHALLLLLPILLVRPDTPAGAQNGPAAAPAQPANGGAAQAPPQIAPPELPAPVPPADRLTLQDAVKIGVHDNPQTTAAHYAVQSARENYNSQKVPINPVVQYAVQLDTPDGYRIPLLTVAQIKDTRGASFIYREAGRRYIAIKFGVRGRDIGGAIAAAERSVKDNVRLPENYEVVFGGEFESMQRAGRRLAVIIPITFLVVFLILYLLLYLLFGRFSRTFIVMMNVPIAVSGGIFLLYLAGHHLSVSAAVGFIALFGVAVQNAVIKVSQIDQLYLRGETLFNAVLDGAASRLRPILMTAMLATIGLVPAAISNGIGSDVQKPLAVAIIGGMVTDVLIGTLFVLPVLYLLIARRYPATAKVGSGDLEPVLD